MKPVSEEIPLTNCKDTKRMLVGYARVSTQDQNLELQRDALQAVKCERIFEDKMSGAKAARPGLTEALEFMRADDTLVIWQLSRLGRTMKQLIETVQLLEEKGIQLRSLHESIDTTTATGKLLFHMIAAFAQFERDTMLENTRAGLQAARARGRKGGRPRKLDAKKVQLAKELRRDRNRSIKEICELLQISRATFMSLPRPLPPQRRIKPTNNEGQSQRQQLPFQEGEARKSSSVRRDAIVYTALHSKTAPANAPQSLRPA